MIVGNHGITVVLDELEVATLVKEISMLGHIIDTKPSLNELRYQLQQELIVREKLD